jgi:type IV pilus assembly protein PilA
MVVVLIIGILIAIALPTFLGARTRSQNRAAQSDLRNAIAAADTYFTDDDSYSGFDATVAESIEPSLAWVAGAGTQDEVGITVVSDTEIYLEKVSASTVTFCLAKDVGTGGGQAQGNDDTGNTGGTFATCTGGW